MLKSFLQKYVEADFTQNSLRCNDWSGEAVAALRPQSLLDVGCGDGSLLLRYLDYKPQRFCGIEAAPELRAKAEKRGIEVADCDLNGTWPYEDNTFDVVHSAQVIEHLHNTRLFVEEIYRVLKPGGTALVTSENLTSFLNLGAMMLGYTPFTMMRVCGWFLGNPLGLHYKKETGEPVPVTDPSFAGVTGHVRVLSVLQAQELFERVGFKTKASSLGLMPIPNLLGRNLEDLMPRRGHFLLIRARKPAPSARRPASEEKPQPTKSKEAPPSQPPSKQGEPARKRPATRKKTTRKKTTATRKSSPRTKAKSTSRRAARKSAKTRSKAAKKRS